MIWRAIVYSGVGLLILSNAACNSASNSASAPTPSVALRTSPSNTSKVWIKIGEAPLLNGEPSAIAVLPSGSLVITKGEPWLTQIFDPKTSIAKNVDSGFGNCSAHNDAEYSQPLSILADSKGAIFVGGQDCRGKWIVRSSLDSGVTWKTSDQTDGIFPKKIIQDIRGNIYAIGSKTLGETGLKDAEHGHVFVRRTTDRGVTWSTVLDADDNGNRVFQYDFVADSQGNLLFVYQPNSDYQHTPSPIKMKISKDGGDSWIQSPDLIDSLDLADLKLNVQPGSNTYYLTIHSGLENVGGPASDDQVLTLKSNDQGNSWQKDTAPLSADPDGLFSIGPDGRWYLVDNWIGFGDFRSVLDQGTQKIYVSEDFGKTWTTEILYSSSVYSRLLGLAFSVSAAPYFIGVSGPFDTASGGVWSVFSLQ